MIGTSTKSHRWWQRINGALGVAGLCGLVYAPIYAAVLLLVSSISGVIEARFDKREVDWRR